MMRRFGGGYYVSLDGRWRIERGWGDTKGWTVLSVATNGDTEVIETCRTLKDARVAMAAAGGER